MTGIIYILIGILWALMLYNMYMDKKRTEDLEYSL